MVNGEKTRLELVDEQRQRNTTASIPPWLRAEDSFNDIECCCLTGESIKLTFPRKFHNLFATCDLRVVELSKKTGVSLPYKFAFSWRDIIHQGQRNRSSYEAQHKRALHKSGPFTNRGLWERRVPLRWLQDPWKWPQISMPHMRFHSA